MVREAVMANRGPTEIDLAAAIEGSIPELPRVLDAAQGARLYLVGGAVRDLLLGRDPAGLDIAVEGDAIAVARRLDENALAHERFLTAATRLGPAQLDLTSTRNESYPEPGALPEVEPAPLEQDLSRRDFTVNAMAVPLQGEPELIDPLGGRADLEQGLLRVLHDRSFLDDPTRALRAARYAGRLGFELEPQSRSLIAGADLGTVSADRRAAELLRIALEPEAGRALRLATEWGLLRARQGAEELLPAAEQLLETSPWDELAARPRTILVAALGPVGREVELAAARPSRPSEGVELAAGARGEELLLARAMGADWLDDYAREWRHVGLEIDGSDLVAAGVEEGPAVGRGLAAALRGKLDGDIDGREEELRAALAAAQEQGDGPGDGDGVA
jgi:tRNA nucleotidyltransferase (CCA-adding enzyme)